MKYAIIGCGRISPNHVVASQKTGLDLVALCDLDLKNTLDKIRKFDLDENYVKQYTDYKQAPRTRRPGSGFPDPRPARGQSAAAASGRRRNSRRGSPLYDQIRPRIPG